MLTEIPSGEFRDNKLSDYKKEYQLRGDSGNLTSLFGGLSLSAQDDFVNFTTKNLQNSGDQNSGYLDLGFKEIFDNALMYGILQLKIQPNQLKDEALNSLSQELQNDNDKWNIIQNKKIKVHAMVNCDSAGRCSLEIRISDGGDWVGFNEAVRTEEESVKNINAPAFHSIPLGGRGLILARAYYDTVKSEQGEDGHTMVLIKNYLNLENAK